MASKKRKGDRDIRQIVVNPYDPMLGEASFTAYDLFNPRPSGGRTHPKDMERARKELRGLQGHRVRVTLYGERRDADTDRLVAYTREHTTRTLNSYRDIFDKNGALLELIKRQIQRKSDDAYMALYIEVEDLD